MPLFHAYNALTNTRGDSLVGFRVVARVPDGGAVAPIYSDGNGTPIATVSGIANTAITDDAGNYSFFIEANGNYDLEYYTPEGVFVSATRNVPLFSGIKGDPGDTGSADNTYATLISFKASDINRRTASLVGVSGVSDGRFNWTLGDYTALAAASPGDYIKADSTALTVGAWVRQQANGVGFRQMAAPAAPTNLQDEARFTVRPEQFGAKGDGSTDDSAAINAAITLAASIGGGDVECDAKSYAVAGPVLMKTGVTLRGRGDSTIIKQIGSNASWSGYANTAGIISTVQTTTYESIIVEQLTVDGINVTAVADGSAFYARIGVALPNCRNSSVRDVFVRNVGTGIIMYRALGLITETDFSNCAIERCRTYNTRSWIGPGNPGVPRAITMNMSYSNVSDCFISRCFTGYYVSTNFGHYRNCRVTDWLDDGFYVNANYCTFTNCSAVAGMGSGFAVNPSVGHIFQGCAAATCSNAGIRYRHAGVTAPRNCTITGCQFEECGYGFLDDMIGADPSPSNSVAAFNTFVGNKAIRCNQSGFRFQRQSASTISDNQAIDCNQAGVTAGTRGGFSFIDFCIGNKIANNVTDDTQSTPTQVFGLYVYGGSGNTGNDIKHKSGNGVDLFSPQRQSGIAMVTIASGTRSIASGTIAFPQAFEGTPKVELTVQNIDVFADAERPIGRDARDVTATGFKIVADAMTNVAASRVVNVGWFATVE